MATASTCIEKRRFGCQDRADTWQWAWSATKLLRKRPGDTLDSVVWTIPPELVLSPAIPTPEGVVGNTAFVWVDVQPAAVTGTAYPLIGQLKTTQGLTITLRIDITVTDVTTLP